jgi:hypothetical protein
VTRATRVWADFPLRERPGVSAPGYRRLAWASSLEFDLQLMNTVRSSYPAHEHERFVAYLRGLVGQWVRERDGQPQWTA